MSDGQDGSKAKAQLVSSLKSREGFTDSFGRRHSFIEIKGVSYEVIERIDGIFEFFPNQAINVDQILNEAGIGAVDKEKWRQIIENDLKKGQFVESNIVSGTVTLGGISFRVSKNPTTGDVELTGRNTLSSQTAFNPLIKQSMEVTVWKQPDGTFAFYVPEFNRTFVSDLVTKTVVLGNYVKYDVTEDPETGKISLKESTRLVSIPPVSQVLEIYGSNYGVVENQDGSYTFYDGLYVYKSDPATGIVKLGQYFRGSYDDYMEHLEKGTLAELQGLIYKIKKDTLTGKISLTDYKETKNKSQIIEISDHYYTVNRDSKSNITISDYESGEIVMTIVPGSTEIVFKEEKFFVTVDPVTKWIHLDSEKTTAESRNVQILRTNGIYYFSTKIGDNKFRTKISGK
jgi:hypothetical protein